MPEFTFKIGDVVRHKARWKANSWSNEVRYFVLVRRHSESKSGLLNSYLVRAIMDDGNVGTKLNEIFEDELELAAESADKAAD